MNVSFVLIFAFFFTIGITTVNAGKYNHPSGFIYLLDLFSNHFQPQNQFVPIKIQRVKQFSLNICLC